MFTLVVAEGWATAMSIHLSTELPVAITFGKGNIKSVAGTLRRLHPTSKIVIAADNDEKSREAIDIAE